MLRKHVHTRLGQYRTRSRGHPPAQDEGAHGGIEGEASHSGHGRDRSNASILLEWDIR